MQEEIEFINNIISSNILASNINMLVANNLNIESRQNTSNSKSMSFGIGASIAKSKGGSSGNANLSYSQSKANRAWVDTQATIIGTDSVTINTGNNTNIKGAVIANITNIPNYSNYSNYSNTVIASPENQGVAIQSFLNSGEAIDGGNLNINRLCQQILCLRIFNNSIFLINLPLKPLKKHVVNLC